MAPSLSVSPSLMMSWISVSVGFCLRSLMTSPSSLVVILPEMKMLESISWNAHLHSSWEFGCRRRPRTNGGVMVWGQSIRRFGNKSRNSSKKKTSRRTIIVFVLDNHIISLSFHTISDTPHADQADEAKLTNRANTLLNSSICSAVKALILVTWSSVSEFPYIYIN